MPVRSMTAWAQTTAETAAGTLTLELRSVNSRFLDLTFKMNDELRFLEPKLRELVSRDVKRGKLECRISFGREAKQGSLALNRTLLTEVLAVQDELRKERPDAREMSVGELLSWPGMIASSDVSNEELSAAVMAAAEELLASYIGERRREGRKTADKLLEKIAEMERIVATVEPLVPQTIEAFKAKSAERMKEALGLASDGAASAVVSKDEAFERIRQEVALYGMKIDVAEEIDRLKIHLEQAKDVFKKGGPLGKRMDFLLQELNREANTLGSKSVSREQTDASVELKLLIEQIREQVQNLE